MQCSNRKFIVASISAVVMLGSSNSVLAQDTSLQSSSAQATSAQEDLSHPRAVVERSTISQLTQQDVASFADDIKDRYGIHTTVETAPETIPSLPVVAPWAIATPVQSVSTDPLSSPRPTDSAAATSERDTDSIDYRIDPQIQSSLQELIDSAEALSEEVRSQSSAHAQSEDSAISVPEMLSPGPEFASTPNTENPGQNGFAFPSRPEIMGQVDSSEVDGSEHEGTVDNESEATDEFDDLELLDDVTLDESDTAEPDPVELEDGGVDAEEFGSDVSTDAATLLAPPPEYLNSDPNPLFFPTEPEEVEIVGNQPITLEQAIALARRNSREFQTELLNLENAQADFREARADRFPTLSVSATLEHEEVNFALPTTTSSSPTFSPAGLFSGFETVETEREDNTTTLSGVVTLEYDLFTSGERRASIRAADRAVRLQELQLEVVAEDIRLNVTNAYYEVQDTRENIRIAQADLEEALTSLRDAEARERAGVGTRFDRLQAEVEVANSQQELRTAISNAQIARRQLADILSLPSGIEVSAADEVREAGVWPLSLEESIIAAFKNRAEPEQQLVQRELERQQRRQARAQTLPQLSIVGQYGFNDLLDRNNAFEDSESFSIAAQLTWLLFDGGATRAAVRGEEIDAQLAEVAFADTLEAIRLEVETAYSQLGANLENIQTAQIAVDVAQESLRLARLRFQAGVGIQSDVITAQSDLTDAEQNLVDAILDYNRALVAIQRAVSNLDGNLADVP